MGRHLGLPFVGNRIGFLVLDKQYAAKARLAKQLIGVKPLRNYLATYID
jgi:hypothetical protein